jgi:hypothetical protein
MFCKIFSDDQEIATNQKIGLCDYLRTEWLTRLPWPVVHSFMTLFHHLLVNNQEDRRVAVLCVEMLRCCMPVRARSLLGGAHHSRAAASAEAMVIIPLNKSLYQTHIRTHMDKI